LNLNWSHNSVVDGKAVARKEAPYLLDVKPSVIQKIIHWHNISTHCSTPPGDAPLTLPEVSEELQETLGTSVQIFNEKV
jgi:hypothetical protein